MNDIPHEIHNAFHIVCLDDRKRTFFGRPDDWYDPRWTYRRYEFRHWDDQGRCYIQHSHCWTDLDVNIAEMTDMFARWICYFFLPGLPIEMCSNDG